MLQPIDIAGKTFTVDALLTQRKFANYLLDRAAHYVFPVKANQPSLLEAIQLLFEHRAEPDFREPLTLAHGRSESRAIWTFTALNDYLDFPGVAQVFLVEPHVSNKKTGKDSCEIAYGITSHSTESADANRLLAK